MTDSSTVDGSAKKIAKVRKLAHEGAALVSGYKLAAHFGMTRQNVDALVSQGVIERRADGKFDQDQSRLKYLTHLRSKSRRSSRAAVDAEHLKVKTEMLQLRVMEKRRELVQLDEVNAMIDALVGLMLTQMSGMHLREGRKGQPYDQGRPPFPPTSPRTGEVKCVHEARARRERARQCLQLQL
jgi:hypothetical protein